MRMQQSDDVAASKQVWNKQYKKKAKKTDLKLTLTPYGEFFLLLFITYRDKI